jgi:hypothetical protein
MVDRRRGLPTSNHHHQQWGHHPLLPHHCHRRIPHPLLPRSKQVKRPAAPLRGHPIRIRTMVDRHRGLPTSNHHHPQLGHPPLRRRRRRRMPHPLLPRPKQIKRPAAPLRGHPIRIKTMVGQHRGLPTRDQVDPPRGLPEGIRLVRHLHRRRLG